MLATLASVVLDCSVLSREHNRKGLRGRLTSRIHNLDGSDQRAVLPTGRLNPKQGVTPWRHISKSWRPPLRRRQSF